MTKCERIDISKGHPNLKIVNCGCGWDIAKGGNQNVDLDIFAFLLSGGKLVDPKAVVYFNNLSYLSVSSSGDNLTGIGSGVDENIAVDLVNLPANVDEVIIGVNIYEAASRRQNFGLVDNAFVQISDAEGTQDVLAKYDLTEDFSAFTGVLLGRLYRNNGEFKFQALGEGRSGSILDLVAAYR